MNYATIKELKDAIKRVCNGHVEYIYGTNRYEVNVGEDDLRLIINALEAELAKKEPVKPKIKTTEGDKELAALLMLGLHHYETAAYEIAKYRLACVEDAAQPLIEALDKINDRAGRRGVPTHMVPSKPTPKLDKPIIVNEAPYTFWPLVVIGAATVIGVLYICLTKI